MRRAFASLAVTAAGILVGSDARADVSSWLAVGGGYAFERNHAGGTNDYAPALSVSLGVGSSPLSSFVLGGIARTTTMFGLGTDVGLAIRGATGGFARGDWGVAVDVGALWRYWRGGDYGTWPLQGVVTIGSPWGLQLGLGTEVWSADLGDPALGFRATLEIDLLRLTVMRQGATERWWYNPFPAGGHMDKTEPPEQSTTAPRDVIHAAARPVTRTNAFAAGQCRADAPGAF